MISEFERHAVEALVDFYSGSFDKFFEYLDDNVIWYGPRKGQVITGKAALRESIGKLRVPGMFVENITTSLIDCSGTNSYIMLTYRLCRVTSGGSLDVAYQRVNIGEHKVKDRDGGVFWKCHVIETSNLLPEKRGGRLVPPVKDRELVESSLMDAASSAARIVLPGDNHNSVYLKENTVRYFEGGKKVFSYANTDRECYKIRLLLKDIEQRLPPGFCRCHSSYIVNMRRILYVSSSAVTLDDGVTTVPISAGRSRKVREEIDAFLTG